jgi:oligopeptide transport system ATP-binding protein
MSEEPLLKVVDYHKHFHISKKLIIKAVDGVSFEVRQGEVFSLVGESGSGKSTVAKGVMGIYPANKGEIYFKGRLISDKRSYKRNRKEIQRGVQIVFQDSAAALNPRMRVFDIIAEPLVVNDIFASKRELKGRIEELMLQVGLDPHFMTKYPNEISGGQRQRVAIARAIGLDPDLIVADEPVASLDVSIQAQIINLFEYLRQERQFTFFFIAHDLALVRYISDRVGVMYAGKIVEISSAAELFTNPRHPYTQSLMSAIPVPDPVFERQKRLIDFDKAKFNPKGVLEQVAEGHQVLV